MKLKLFALFFLFLLLTGFASRNSAASEDNENFVFCTSCEDCTEKAKTPDAKIKLANDLEYSGRNSCIKISADGISFDGNDFSISISDGIAVEALKIEDTLYNITIKNLNIQAAGRPKKVIALTNCSFALLISNNIHMETSIDAIRLENTSNSKILDNNITTIRQPSSAPNGIVLARESNNNIIDNNSIDLDEYMINTNSNCILTTDYSSNNFISNNKLSRASMILNLGAGSNNQVTGNRIEGATGAGIYLGYTGHPGNIISNNIVRNNRYAGIQTAYHYTTANHEIKNNLITMNNFGIVVFGTSTNFKITGNRITSNLKGIFLTNTQRVTDYLIYNNLFKNENNVPVQQLLNNNIRWNIALTPGTNILGGKNLGGNAWSNPNDQGYSDHCADEDVDEICDEPYVLDRYNTDQFPLRIYPPD